MSELEAGSAAAIWMGPPHLRTSARVNPAASSTAATVNMVESFRNGGLRVRPVDSRRGERCSLICVREVMPVDSWTAKPMTSQEGNTAIHRIGWGSVKGPVPL